MAYSLLISFLMCFPTVHASMVAEPVESMKSNKPASTSSCESVLMVLAKRKRDFSAKVSESNTFNACLESVKEEQELPMSIPVNCQNKKLGDMSEKFRQDISSFDSDPNVDTSSFDKNQKVTSFISNIRADMHDMFLDKCKGRERARLDKSPTRPTMEQKMRVESAR